MVVRSSVEHLLYPVAGVEPVTDKDKDKDKEKTKTKTKTKTSSLPRRELPCYVFFLCMLT